MKGFLCKCTLLLLAVLLLGAAPVSAAVVSNAATPGPPGGDESSQIKATEEPVQEVYDPNITMTVRYDYDDKVRPGYTIPAFIEIQNNGPELEGELRLSVTPERMGGGAGGALVYTMDVRVDENGTANYMLPFQSVSTRNIQLHLYRNGSVAAKAKYPKLGVGLTTKTLLGVLSDNQPSVAYWMSVKVLHDADGMECQVSPVELSAADFPDKGYLMDRFSMLVLNHFDISLLSSTQQEVLADWVKGGGILLTDADPANAPAVSALSPMLEVAVTGEANPEGVTQKLYELANTSNVNQQEITSLGVVEPAGKVVFELDHQPLMMEYAADKGRVYLTTFSLSSPALSHSGVITGLLNNITGLSALGAYEIEQLAYGSYSYGGSTLSKAVRGTSWMDAVTIDWVLILIVVFILLAGPVNYAVLAAKDKRDWIWVTAPALAVVFCVVIIGVGSAQHGTDVISSVVNVVDRRSGNSTQSYSEVGIGAPGSGSYEVQIPEESLPSKYLYSDYYNDMANAPDVTKVGEPSLLFDLSGQTKVTFPNISRWNMDSFTLSREIQMEGGLESEIWQKGKKNYYYVKNGTDLELEDVTIVAPGGYIRIPLLEPGEEKSGELGNYAASAGAGYSVMMGMGQMNYWTIISELYSGPQYQYYTSGSATGAPPSDDRSVEQKREEYIKYTIMDSLMNYNGYPTSANPNDTSARYTMWAWSRSLGALDMEVNGRPVKNEQNLTVILDETILNFKTDEGISIPNGYVAGKVSDIGKLVNGSVFMDTTGGYVIEGEVILDFKLPEDISDYELTAFTLGADYNTGTYSIFLRNQVTEEWHEIIMNRAFSPENLGEFVNEENTVQLMIQKEAGTMEANFDYMTLAVEGKVK